MDLDDKNLTPSDYLEVMGKKHRFMDVLAEEQEKYSTNSLEYESFKLAITAIAFSIVLYADEVSKKIILTESQRERISKTKKMLDQEYKAEFPCEEEINDDISLKDVPGMRACLKGLLEKYEKNTEVFAALQCSLGDIETAMKLEKRFEAFLKTV